MLDIKFDLAWLVTKRVVLLIVGPWLLVGLLAWGLYELVRDVL